MGVDVTTYLIYGIVLNEEQNKYVKENWWKHDLPVISYIEGRVEAEGHLLIKDDMIGKNPTIFGKVLYSSLKDNGIKKIPLVDYKYKTQLINHFIQCFPERFKFENELDLMIVTHYS